MTVAAESTTDMRIGCMVFNNDLRSPVVLAKELATLDLISDGRLDVGLGAGWFRADYTEAGIAYDRPGVRIDRLAEALHICKTMWSDGSASAQGTHYQVRDALGLPATVQRPHPPIMIGGGGRRMLTLAAQEADIIGINQNLVSGTGTGPEVAASSVSQHFRERAALVHEIAGPRIRDVDLQCLTRAIVTDDAHAAYQRIAEPLGISAEDAARTPVGVAGSVAAICDVLVERREVYGFNYIVVAAEAMTDFAPVIETLTGA